MKTLRSLLTLTLLASCQGSLLAADPMPYQEWQTQADKLHARIVTLDGVITTIQSIEVDDQEEKEACAVVIASVLAELDKVEQELALLNTHATHHEVRPVFKALNDISATIETLDRSHTQLTSEQQLEGHHAQLAAVRQRAQATADGMPDIAPPVSAQGSQEGKSTWQKIRGPLFWSGVGAGTASVLFFVATMISMKRKHREKSNSEPVQESWMEMGARGTNNFASKVTGGKLFDELPAYSE